MLVGSTIMHVVSTAIVMTPNSMQTKNQQVLESTLTAHRLILMGVCPLHYGFIEQADGNTRTQAGCAPFPLVPLVVPLWDHQPSRRHIVPTPVHKSQTNHYSS